jgi:hypothetical protein
LATHKIVPAKEAVSAVGRMLDELAARENGEYDGWEAAVER